MQEKRSGFTLFIEQNSFPFLAPRHEVFDLLRINLNAYHVVTVLEKEFGTSSGVGKTSLYKIMRPEGVGNSTLQKLNNFFQHRYQMQAVGVFSFKVMRAHWKALRYRANAAGWIAPVAVFKKPGRAPELDLLCDFLERRAHEELAFIKQARAITKRDPNPPRVLQVNEAVSFLSQFTLIPKHVLIAYRAAIQELEEKRKIDEIRILPYWLFFQADFYQSAIAHFELGVQSALEQHGIEDRWIADATLMKSISPKLLAQEPNQRRALNNLLEVIRIGQNTSWRALAQSIPDSVSSKQQGALSGELEHDLKYSQLKKWRRGEAKDVPGRETIQAFLVDLYGERSMKTYLFSYWFSIAIATDKWVNQSLALLKSAGAESSEAMAILQEVLDHYPAHYSNALRSHSSEKAA